MKPGAKKRSIKPWNKALTLFSRLSGVGIAGFNSYPGQQKEEKPIQLKENQTVSNCQNQNHRQEQYNGQPGEYHSRYTSVDLWFYLSGQA